jgi:hypothetical protein
MMNSALTAGNGAFIPAFSACAPRDLSSEVPANLVPQT